MLLNPSMSVVRTKIVALVLVTATVHSILMNLHRSVFKRAPVTVQAIQNVLALTEFVMFLLLMICLPAHIVKIMSASQVVLTMEIALMDMNVMREVMNVSKLSASMIQTVLDLIRSVMLPMITASSVVMAAIVLPQMGVAKVAMIVI